MKIIKKIKVEKNLSFQIYKPEDTYNYFFVILINEEGFIKVQKINNNLKIIESYKILLNFLVLLIILLKNQNMMNYQMILSPCINVA